MARQSHCSELTIRKGIIFLQVLCPAQEETYKSKWLWHVLVYEANAVSVDEGSISFAHMQLLTWISVLLYFCIAILCHRGCCHLNLSEGICNGCLDHHLWWNGQCAERAYCNGHLEISVQLNGLNGEASCVGAVKVGLHQPNDASEVVLVTATAYTFCHSAITCAIPPRTII